MVAPLLRAEKLRKYFPVSKGIIRGKNNVQVRAVDGISFDISHGETLGLVSESGCGKTTTSKLILRLIHPTSGEVVLKGRNIRHFKGEDLKKYRATVQAVFQDPSSSLSPRMRVKDIVAEPLIINRRASQGEVKDQVEAVLQQVGLHPSQAQTIHMNSAADGGNVLPSPAPWCPASS